MSGLFGGGSQPQQQQPTSSTVTQTNLPAWAQPYSEDVLGRAQALTTQNPYQSYQGQRTADFTPMQQQAFNTIGNMQVSPQNQQASNIGAATGIGGLMAGQNYNQMATNPNAVQAFMSPYQQNVTDYQKQQAVMDYGRQLPGQQAQATNAGAFGGSRQAIVEGEGQRNLQNTLAGIQATGSQNAFNNAQQAQQFGANLGLQGMGLANQSAGLMGQMGQQNYAQQMGINAAQQQAGAQQQAFNQQGLSNQYQDFLNQQNYPYQQLGFMSDILHGTPTGSTSTSQTSAAPPSMFGQIAGLGLAGYGISNALNKKAGGIIQGYKHGGEVRHFDGGGITSLLADPETEIAAKSKLPPINQATALAKFMLPAITEMHRPVANPGTTTVAEDMAREILSRGQPQQPQQQMPQQPQQPQQMEQAPQQEQAMADGGLAGLPINNFAPEHYEGGGIIAFQNAGAVPAPNGDFVESETGLMVPKSETDQAPLDMSSAGFYKRAIDEQNRLREQYTQPTMAGEVASAREAQQQALKAAGITGNIGDKRQKQLEDLQLTEGDRKKEAFNNFLISTGLGMASEASKYGRPQSGILSSITQPLSVGAAQAFPGFMSEQKDIRNLTNSRDKELAELENMRRAEASGIAKIAQSSFDKKEDRIKAVDVKLAELNSKRAGEIATKEAAIAGKAPNDMAAYVRDYVASARESGSNQSDSTLSTKARDAYLKLKGAYDPRYAGVSATERGQDVTSGTGEQGQQIKLIDESARFIKDRLDEPGTPENREQRRLIKLDKENSKTGTPSTMAINYVKQLQDDEYKRRLDQLGKPSAPKNEPKTSDKTSTAPNKPPYNTVEGAPKGGSIGEFVPSKGWQIKNADGKVTGYAQP